MSKPNELVFVSPVSSYHRRVRDHSPGNIHLRNNSPMLDGPSERLGGAVDPDYCNCSSWCSWGNIRLRIPAWAIIVAIAFLNVSFAFGGVEPMTSWPAELRRDVKSGCTAKVLAVSQANFALANATNRPSLRSDDVSVVDEVFVYYDEEKYPPYRNVSSITNETLYGFDTVPYARSVEQLWELPMSRVGSSGSKRAFPAGAKVDIEFVVAYTARIGDTICITLDDTTHVPNTALNLHPNLTLTVKSELVQLRRYYWLDHEYVAWSNVDVKTSAFCDCPGGSDTCYNGYNGCGNERVCQNIIYEDVANDCPLDILGGEICQHNYVSFSSSQKVDVQHVHASPSDYEDTLTSYTWCNSGVNNCTKIVCWERTNGEDYTTDYKCTDDFWNPAFGNYLLWKPVQNSTGTVAQLQGSELPGNFRVATFPDDHYKVEEWNDATGYDRHKGGWVKSTKVGGYNVDNNQLAQAVQIKEVKSCYEDTYLLHSEYHSSAKPDSSHSLSSIYSPFGLYQHEPRVSNDIEQFSLTITQGYATFLMTLAVKSVPIIMTSRTGSVDHFTISHNKFEDDLLNITTFFTGSSFNVGDTYTYVQFIADEIVRTETYSAQANPDNVEFRLVRPQGTVDTRLCSGGLHFAMCFNMTISGEDDSYADDPMWQEKVQQFFEEPEGDLDFFSSDFTWDFLDPDTWFETWLNTLVTLSVVLGAFVVGGLFLVMAAVVLLSMPVWIGPVLTGLSWISIPLGKAMGTGASMYASKMASGAKTALKASNPMNIVKMFRKTRTAPEFEMLNVEPSTGTTPQQPASSSPTVYDDL